MGMFATPRTASTGSDDELRKADLLDALVVFRVDEFEPAALTKYGTSASIRCHVTVVDGPHAGKAEARFFAAGNLARQIGQALDVGAMAPGRIRRGSSADRDWWGVDWATAPEDLSAAEAALKSRGVAERLPARQAAPDFDEEPPF